jgi:hypothetical protein
MHNDRIHLRDDLRRAELARDAAQRVVDEVKARITAFENRCSHKWGDPVYTPDRTKGYMAQNWMGPIRNGQPALPDVYVEPTEKPKWTRTCSICDKTEVTTKTTERVTHTPQF